MTTTKYFLIINCFCILLVSCKKDSADPEITIEGAPTEIGEPDGESFNKVIGSSGGNIISSDNRFEMIISSGVLSSDINISIESISNMAPGGTGKAYRLSTEDVAFNFPVTLVVHYKPDDLSGTLAEDLGIAFQDSTGIWHSPYKFNLDSVAGTISTTITDYFNQSIKTSSKSGKAKSAKKFRDHAVTRKYSLVAQKSSLRTLESSPVTLMYLKNADQISAANSTVTDVGTDDLPPLPNWVPYQDASKITWYANGLKNGSPGTGVLSSGNPSTYTAPGAPPSKNPVEIKAVISKKKGKYTVPIKILGDVYNYKLKIGYKMVGSSYWLTDTYTDSAEMNISVTNLKVNISDTINKLPSDDKPSGTAAGCTYQWLPDNIGMVNIKEVSGMVVKYSSDNQSYEFLITCTQGKLYWPRWQATCNSVTTPLDAGTFPPGSHISFSFYLNDAQQEQQEKEDGHYAAKLIPLASSR